MGMALDRAWNVVLANDTAMLLLEMLPAELQTGPVNLFRVSLHPDGFAQMTRNFDEWAAYLLDLLRRMVRITGDERLAELEREVSSYPTVAGLSGGRVSHRSGGGGLVARPARARGRRPDAVLLQYVDHVRVTSGRDARGADHRAVLSGR